MTAKSMSSIKPVQTVKQTQHRAWSVIAGVITLLILGLIAHGKIVQPSSYHQFADQRAQLGIPHFMDVISNLPFLMVGLWGISLSLSVVSNTNRRAWVAFFVAVAFTCFGSSFYHWSPNDLGLMVDRLPIAWACAFLSCALLAERLDARLADRTSLLVAFIIATLSVLYWYNSQLSTATQGDLRPYLVVQFLPMFLVPICLWLAPATSHKRVITGAQWLTVLGLYALAKVFEVADHAVFAQLGEISGHTIKHLLAALAAAYLARALFVANSQSQAKIG